MENDQNLRQFTTSEIKRLVSLLEESSLHHIKVRRGEHKIELSKGSLHPVVPSYQVQPTNTAPSAPAASSTHAPETIQSATSEPKPQGEAVTSPMVGTFYRATSPTSPNLVDLDQSVEEGQALCIVEAMKMMNQIKAPAAGKITHIAVNNGDPVEYGQVLFYIA